MTKFWIETLDINTFFKSLQNKNPNITLWDILSDYNPMYDDENQEVDEDEFDFPQLPLASSNSFFNYKIDADDLDMDYEERERLVKEKWEHYKNEISKLLQQEPSESLLPKVDHNRIDNSDDLWESFYGFCEVNPFTFEFEEPFAAWDKGDKILFLNASQEDNELPFEIKLGGLSKEKYMSILKQYNNYGK